VEADRIALELPADPAYERVASIAASNMAHHHGFSLTRIDDLVRALVGAIDVLLGCATPQDRLRVSYLVGDGELVIHAELTASGRGLADTEAQALAAAVHEVADAWTASDRSLHLEFRDRRAA
jgi:hypothetical protein